jgi:carbon storage regulator
MLVLSRKVGDKIVIGDKITVTLVRLAGNRVSIGVDAPDDVRVMRGELAGVGDRSETGDCNQTSGKSCTEAGSSCNVPTAALTAETLAP